MIGDKKLVAVCIAKIGEDERFKFIQALQRCFEPEKYYMLIYHTCTDFFWKTPNEESEKSIFKLIDYDIIDAMVIFNGTFLDEAVPKKIAEDAKKHNLPILCVNGYAQDCVSVWSDYEACFQRIIEHVIIDHGIQDIRFISGFKGNPFAESRLQTFREVMEQNGLPCEEDRIYYGDFWADPTKKVVAQMISEGKVPKAIICANDAMAIATCQELEPAGYRVPEDVIVTGFDGTLEGLYMSPSLTSCDSNYLEMGGQIVTLLKQIWAGEELNKEYRVPFSVRLGQSCGCIKEPTMNVGVEMLQIGGLLSYYKELDRNLYEASSEILVCNSERRISQVLEKCMPENAICMVDKEFWETENAMEVTTGLQGVHQPRYILFDSRKTYIGDGDIECKYEETTEILPGLYDLLNLERPLVLTTISFWNRAIGYVGTYFDVIPSCYLSISQCAMGISNALGGFYNIRYQHYLNGQIEKIYAYDSLTGLLNRQGFYKYSKTVIDNMRADEKLLLLSTDLDGLKHINDCYGHLEGDNAIATAAQALLQAYPEGKICFRFGGDEMLCLIPVSEEMDMDELQIEDKIRESITQYLDEYNKTSGKPYEVSMSMGFFFENVVNFSLEKLIKAADDKMYSEKKLKKQRGKIKERL